MLTNFSDSLLLRVLSVAWGFLVAMVPGLPAAPQETTNWRDFQYCDDCPLKVREVVRFGDATGPGMIESDLLVVRWGPNVGYLMLEERSSTVKVFDENGRFQRSIGRSGEGPGEFGIGADAHEVEGKIVVLDVRSRRWLFFTTSGEYMLERAYGLTAGPFVPVGDNHVVVVSIDRRPDVVGFPLHLVDLTDGRPSLHFGTSSSDWVATAPYSTAVLGGVLNPPGSVWWGRLGSPAVQKWSLDGKLLRAIEGELPWFPDVPSGDEWRSYEEPQATLFVDLAVDAEERLWMLTYVPDPQWKAGDYAVGERPDSDRYRDMRLDIFDLASRQHLGRHIWDSGRAVLFDHGGKPAVAVLEYHKDLIPKVAVYMAVWN